VLTKAGDPQLASTRPYTPLELEGRDVYLREGCYHCHSQMIRPLLFETQRYGDASRIADSAFDHPFQWGSKRTGPDLARIGGKYPNLWHYQHLLDPRSTSPGSNMPPYAFMAGAKVDFAKTEDKVHAMQTLGVPYTDAEVRAASAAAHAQAETIAKDLRAQGADVAADAEIVALVAYLQHLGQPPTQPKQETPPVAQAH
jgi:cytochrome c oxidase cbb3-type subunit I/II